jgi:hypothetical protein
MTKPLIVCVVLAAACTQPEPGRVVEAPSQAQSATAPTPSTSRAVTPPPCTVGCDTATIVRGHANPVRYRSQAAARQAPDSTKLKVIRGISHSVLDRRHPLTGSGDRHRYPRKAGASATQDTILRHGLKNLYRFERRQPQPVWRPTVPDTAGVQDTTRPAHFTDTIFNDGHRVVLQHGQLKPAKRFQRNPREPAQADSHPKIEVGRSHSGYIYCPDSTGRLPGGRPCKVR